MQYVKTIKDGLYQNKHAYIRPVFFILFSLIITILAVYWQVNQYQFVNFDDYDYVANNRNINKGLTFESILWAFTAVHAHNWHPLTWLSHGLDVTLYGINAGAHHITNVLLHCINAVLLFLVMQRMTGAVWRSGLVAALFALHPLNVETVAWIAERKNLLCTFFQILTIWSYVIYSERPGILKYLLVVFFFILGLMSKPMIVTLPFVLLLLDYWPLNRFKLLQSGNRAFIFNRKGTKITANRLHLKPLLYLVIEKTPLFIFTGIVCLITFWAQNKSGAVVSLDALPLLTRIVNALNSYFFYIWKMIWPTHLAVLYPFPAISLARTIGVCIILTSIFLLVIKNREKHPYLIIGWFWYLGTLAPVIGLVQTGPQSMADRYAYIPLTGLFIIIVWGINAIYRRWHCPKIYIAMPVLAVLFFFAHTSWRQTAFWKDSIALFKHAIEVSDKNYIAHNNLGVAYADGNQFNKAIKQYEKALRIKPNYLAVHNNLGTALAAQNKIDEAIRHYRTALKIKPDASGVHNNLGLALMQQGEQAKAILHYRKAIQVAPANSDLYINLGIALYQQGNLNEALGQYKKAMHLTPDNKLVYFNLGNLRLEQGQPAKAIKCYKTALLLDPSYALAHNNLGVVLYQKGMLSRAIGHFRQALKQKPDYQEARRNLKQALKNKTTPKRIQ